MHKNNNLCTFKNILIVKYTKHNKILNLLQTKVKYWFNKLCGTPIVLPHGPLNTV